jgi:KUP system potassium uptake protein
LPVCGAKARHGGIGKFFGPITLVWFAAIAVLGCRTSCTTRKSWRPQPALRAGLHVDNPGTTFIILGAVVLCVTGAEALYADLGHFGKRPIRLAWFRGHAGAHAQLLRPGRAAAGEPEAVKNPFYMMAPDWA